VVHLLRRVSVAMQHPVGCDDYKWVGPERQGEKEAKRLSPTVSITSLCLFPGLWVRERHTAMLFVFYIKASLTHFCGIYFMHH
jgi:hypothetical protein